MASSRYRFPTRRAGIETLLSRIAGICAIADADMAVLRGLDDWRGDPPGVELVPTRGPAGPRLLIEGWAARCHRLSDGRRQIHAFILPGEFVGARRGIEGRGTRSTVSLTGVQTLDATRVFRAVSADATQALPLSRVVASLAALEQARLLNQIVRLGRHGAYARMCHLVLELHDSAAAAGLTTGDSMAFPLTQEMLADATGLSVVHVNRVLQQLRRDGLLDVVQNSLTLLQRDAMADAADYRPAVLETP